MGFPTMRLSIIIPVLNSHEILRRQILHFSKMNLLDTEIIIIDDGSEPQLEVPDWIRIHRTNDKRAWTWALARNAGAKIAIGEYLLMVDIDHIISEDLINFVKTTKYQKVQFLREFGILDEEGNLKQDENILLEYGLDKKILQETGLYIAPLPNNFAIRKDIFWKLGGYREDYVNRPYPQGEDGAFRAVWQEWVNNGNGQVDTFRPTLYMFPNGKYCGDVDYNPFGLFHNLTRKTKKNGFWVKK